MAEAQGCQGHDWWQGGSFLTRDLFETANRRAENPERAPATESWAYGAAAIRRGGGRVLQLHLEPRLLQLRPRISSPATPSRDLGVLWLARDGLA